MPETTEHAAAVDTAHRAAVTTTLDELVRVLEETLGRNLVAYIADVEPKTVDRWGEGGMPRSRAVEERLRVAFHVFQLLLSRERSDTVRAWFIGINPQLDDISPAQALHDGQLRDVTVAAKSFVMGG